MGIASLFSNIQGSLIVEASLRQLIISVKLRNPPQYTVVLEEPKVKLGNSEPSISLLWEVYTPSKLPLDLLPSIFEKNTKDAQGDLFRSFN